MSVPAAIVDAASSLGGCLVLALGLGMLQAAILESVASAIRPAFQRRPWWPKVWLLQADVLKDYGYEEEECTEAACLCMYTLVCVFSSFHIVNGSALLPVVICGWEGAGAPGQALFFLGTLGDAGIGIYEMIKHSCLCLLPSKFEWWGPRATPKFVIVVCLLHHAVSLATVIPLTLRYPNLPAYEYMACSLLLSSGICFAVGEYKFTLDVSSRCHLVLYKVIVLVQLVANWASRGVIWVWTTYAILRHLIKVHDMLYFGVGVCTSSAFTLFNLFLLRDATCAAIKWLPKSTHEDPEDSASPEQGETSKVP